MRNLYEVGVIIDDELTVFSYCTNEINANKAKETLEKGGWEGVQIKQSVNDLDSITINNKLIDLDTESIDDIKKLKEERRRFLTIAYNAISFGQLDERFEHEELLEELGCSEEEWKAIMEE